MPEQYESQMTADSFNRLYEDKMKEADSYREAYDRAEEEHINNYGRPRYGSYRSFYLVRYRKVKGN